VSRAVAAPDTAPCTISQACKPVFRLAPPSLFR